jgi:hypothetical protein
MTAPTWTCANHPDRTTMLRCNRCEKPICSKCAVQTPVGYRCKECVRGQQAVFETATRLDRVVAAIVAAIATGVAVALLTFIGFWGLLVAPVVGGGVAEVVRWAVRRRRSRQLPWAAGIGGAVGAAANLLGPAFNLLLALTASGDGSFLAGALLSAGWRLAFAVLIVGAMVARLRGIRIGG